MANKEVFQAHQELDRLAVQSRLMKSYEQPVYRRLLSGRSGLKLLDVGCNDGRKTVDLFSCEEVAQVVALEYHGELADQAQRNYGGNGFSFYQCDVEAPDFPRRLQSVMEETGVEGFDLIYASFVLMHLNDPGRLLGQLRDALTPGGRLIVVEANDAVSRVSPDPDGLLPGFLQILSLDPLAGDRSCGSKVPAMLAQGGYRAVTLECSTVGAGVGDPGKKQALFDMFFSYLPQDLRLLRAREPDNPRYAVCAAWLDRHYADLRRLILAENTDILMGVSIITCVGG